MSGDLHQQLSQLRQHFGGWNPPANKSALQNLQDALGKLPNDVLQVYADHNGQIAGPPQGKVWSGSRLMPIEEAIQANKESAWFVDSTPKLGNIALLWTDDNSNSLGVYTSGLLTGWLTVLDHEEPILVPAFRTVAAFYDRLLASLPGLVPEPEAAYDLRMVPRELPVVADDPTCLVGDRELVAAFHELFSSEVDADLRRLYAMCAICLTPVVDTASVLPYLQERDMWTPEAAVRVLELRRFGEGLAELEGLAMNGTPNGDSAAMRQLVRMDTAESQNAVDRLKLALSGQKLQVLEMWMNSRSRLQPPRWP